jgi:hypothetical protein
MEKKMVQDPEKQPVPTSVGRKGGHRVLNASATSSSLIDKGPENENQDSVAVTVVDMIVDCDFIVLRIENYLVVPHVWRYVYRNGRRRRLYGDYRDARVTLRRYDDLLAAARAYDAMRRSLGLGRFPFRDYEQPRRSVSMGALLITGAAANTKAGQNALEFLREGGVPIAAEPVEERNVEELWYCPKDFGSCWHETTIYPSGS